MKLAEPRRDEQRHQLFGTAHRSRGDFLPPGVGTKVISAEPYPIGRVADAISDVMHKCPKARRRESGVATELIHLVGRGLDQQRRAARAGLAQRRLDHERMRRAQRVDTCVLPALVACDELDERRHAEGSPIPRADAPSVATVVSSGCSASSSAASSASPIPASLIGPGITLARIIARIAVMSGAPALMSGDTMIALPYLKAKTSVRAPIEFSTWIAAASPGPSMA